MRFYLMFVSIMVSWDITLQTSTNTNKVNDCNVPKITKEELDKMLATLKTELKVDKKMTSYHKRKLISAPDDRISSRSIGFVAVFVICVPVVFLVVMDISRLVFWWRHGHGDPKPKHRKPNTRRKMTTQK